MNYYKRHIGDYAKKCGRLSMLEHGAYTLLIDACYDRERFPTTDEAYEWCWARNPDELVAVEFVLNRFFELKDGLWVQTRIAEEVAHYHQNAETNRRIATEREAKRTNRAKTVNKSSTVEHEPPPNHKPLTINQYKPTSVSQEVWDSFVKQRKTKKAPITALVLKNIASEAEVAGWTMEQALTEICVRGWMSFKAEWVAPKQSFVQQKESKVMSEYEKMMGRA